MGDIRWKKCNKSDLFAWKNAKLYALYLFLALILVSQSSLYYTHTDIILVAKRLIIPMLI